MVHRVRWPIRQRQAIDRQLATTVQEPLHHREGPYTLVSRLDRDGDSSGPGSRPQSQDRRYRENAKKGPLVEPHLGPVQPIVAVHLPTAPRFPQIRSPPPPRTAQFPSDIDTTARYAHLAQDSLQETAERIAESIAADIL